MFKQIPVRRDKRRLPVTACPADGYIENILHLIAPY